MITILTNGKDTPPQKGNQRIRIEAFGIDPPALSAKAVYYDYWTKLRYEIDKESSKYSRNFAQIPSTYLHGITVLMVTTGRLG